MIKETNKKLINLTKQEFQPYYDVELTDNEACEIINNFAGYVKLLMKLEKKRLEVEKNG